jgi:hypothetical protein
MLPPYPPLVYTSAKGTEYHSSSRNGPFALGNATDSHVTATTYPVQESLLEIAQSAISKVVTSGVAIFFKLQGVRESGSAGCPITAPIHAIVDGFAGTTP